MIKNLSHISLSTNSLKKVYNFYVKLLGLKIVHKFVNKNTKEVYGYFISSNNNTFLEFFKRKKKINFKRNDPFRHVCFEVKDLKKVAKKFKSKKPIIKRGKTDNILQFMVKDNEGNLIEFHQRDKRSKFKL